MLNIVASSRDTRDRVACKPNLIAFDVAVGSAMRNRTLMHNRDARTRFGAPATPQEACDQPGSSAADRVILPFCQSYVKIGYQQSIMGGGDAAKVLVAPHDHARRAEAEASDSEGSGGDCRYDRTACRPTPMGFCLFFVADGRERHFTELSEFDVVEPNDSQIVGDRSAQDRGPAKRCQREVVIVAEECTDLRIFFEQMSESLRSRLRDGVRQGRWYSARTGTPVS